SNPGAVTTNARSPSGIELMVASVAEQGGAQEAGLRPGDRVVAVQGQPVSEIGYQRALRRLKGPEGTAVEVEVRPVGSKATEILRVERRNGYVDRVR
ncbi:MAG: PDZ domain-containing protein, partial [Myxococcota bacterium]